MPEEEEKEIPLDEPTYFEEVFNRYLKSFRVENNQLVPGPNIGIIEKIEEEKIFDLIPRTLGKGRSDFTSYKISLRPDFSISGEVNADLYTYSAQPSGIDSPYETVSLAPIVLSGLSEDFDYEGYREEVEEEIGSIVDLEMKDSGFEFSEVVDLEKLEEIGKAVSKGFLITEKYVEEAQEKAKENSS